MKVSLEIFLAYHTFILCVIFNVDQQSLIQSFPSCGQARPPPELCGMLVFSMYKIQMLLYFKDLFLTFIHLYFI